MRVTILLLTILFSTIGFSQNFNLSGNVVENVTPFNSVGNAIITIEDTGHSTVSDSEGDFSINEKIPSGEQIVTISKDGYDTKYLLIDVVSNGKISTKIELEVSKKELKRRKKVAKGKNKTIKKAKKEKEKEVSKIAKQKKKLSKKKKKLEPVVVVATETKKETSPNFNLLQKKYGNELNVSPSEISSESLYTFIDEWIDRPYLIGGETENGIDCSSFTQRLFINVYDLYVERTAQKQFDSSNTDKFLGQEYLKEGDLVFFGQNTNNVTHVGIYLGNGRFVNSTSRKGPTGKSGVKISSLKDPYWTRIFLAGGRRTDIK